MKILMVSMDRNILNPDSEARRRMVEYGGLADELHIVIFARKNPLGSSASKWRISDNVFAYPTNSFNRCFYVSDAVKIGGEIIKSSGGEFLVTAQDPFETGLAGYFIAKKSKSPLQLQVHTDFLSPYFKKGSFLNRIRVLLAKFLIPRANCVRVVSERIKKSLGSAKAPSKNRLSLPSLRSGAHPYLRFFGGTFAPPAAVLPIFVDIEKIKNAPIKINLHEQHSQFDFIILMASRLTKEKNIGMAIEAMKGVVKQYSKAGLVIVGSGPEEKKLKAAGRKLKENIVFEGWTDDLAPYCKTADLFLLTSNYEGYGRTVIEAMAASCPVVMTDVGVAGETIKDGYNGLVVPVGDARALEEALLKIIGDEFLRGNLAVSAEYTLRNFPSKAEYLEQHKKAWENCAAKANKTEIVDKKPPLN